MVREHRILSALNDTDVPHPTAIALCDDESVLGAAFYLMDFVDGWSVMANPGHWPAPFDTDIAARPGLAYELVDGAAKMANVDWKGVGLEGSRQAGGVPLPPGRPLAVAVGEVQGPRPARASTTPSSSSAATRSSRGNPG